MFHHSFHQGVRNLSKKSKKDGGTKQNQNQKPKNKTSGSANGQNGYH
ncbi:conserved hypothetical protein [Bacillus sp. 349Y]|nr:conserved hypothetical protein [Bacillus sp. 349Y]